MFVASRFTEHSRLFLPFLLQELKDEIDSHTQSVEVVLRLCSLLQDDAHHPTPGHRERESLQLGAINVERRWQNIRTHSQEMLAQAKDRVEAYRVSTLTKSPE